MSRLWIAMLALGMIVGCGDTKKDDKKVEPVKEGEKKAQAPADTDAAQVTQVSFTVPTMECAINCAPKVKSTLSEQPGFVKDVTIDIETHTATIEVEKGKFNAEAAIAALAEAGYEGATIKN